MIDIEKWQEIFSTLKQHKLRTALTAFGVFWGIFMLVVLLGAGKGLQNGATANFGEVTNSVVIWVSNRPQLPYQGLSVNRWVTIKEEDIPAIRNRFSDIAYIEGFNRLGGWGNEQYIVRGNNSGTFSVRGSHEGAAPLHSVRATTGRFINQMDNDRRRKVAVIGQGVEDILFEPWEDPIGQDINIHGVNFMVVGVFATQTTGDNAAQEEEAIYIPNQTLRYTFNQTGWVGNINIVPVPGVHASELEESVIEFLRQRHRVHPDDAGVYGSWNRQEQYENVQSLFTGIRVFSWMVAIGTIAAGAIGVGNIMLIVVKERTREIGLRKALGSTPTAIVTMIVQESIFITALAGYMGLVAGVLVLEGLNAYLLNTGVGAGTFMHPEIEFGTAITAVAILVLSGFLAALLPAAKAASVNPIVALQDE